jgi:hypothetical protein
MKGWHLVAVFVIAYIIGAMFPGPFMKLKGAVGGAAS